MPSINADLIYSVSKAISTGALNSDGELGAGGATPVVASSETDINNVSTSSFADGQIVYLSSPKQLFVWNDSDESFAEIRVFSDFKMTGIGQATTSGYMGGGQTGTGNVGSGSNVIDKWSLTSNGNATDVGDLLEATGENSGFMSSSHGYSSGGNTPSYGPYLNRIQKYPFASDGNATNVGNLASNVGRGQQGSVSAGATNKAYSVGGFMGPSSSVQSNATQKYSLASDGNAALGPAGHGTGDPAGIIGIEHGYFVGGRGPMPSTSIGSTAKSKFSFASESFQSHPATIETGWMGSSGHQSGSDGYYVGGFRNPPANYMRTIYKFPFASDTDIASIGRNATQLGMSDGVSSQTFGFRSGAQPMLVGYPSSTIVNVIDKFPFANNANSSDVGDLTVARARGSVSQT